MDGSLTEKEKTDTRHLRGFRRFQNAALKALAVVVRLLDGGAEDDDPPSKAAVKVSDMKSLVSTYKEAVVGERLVIGADKIESIHNNDKESPEMCLRWVIDETAGPGGAGAEDE